MPDAKLTVARGQVESLDSWEIRKASGPQAIIDIAAAEGNIAAIEKTDEKNIGGRDYFIITYSVETRG